MKIQTYKEPKVWSPKAKLVAGEVVDKTYAHKQGLLHKSAHLLVVENDVLFCRRRAQEEKRYTGLLTTTLGTHVGLNEEYLDTLETHVPSLQSQQLFFAGEFRVHDDYENEVCGLYFTNTKKLLNNIGGVQEKKSFSELEKEIMNQKTTPHLQEAYKLLRLIL